MNSDTQAASIRKSIQAEAQAKDELMRELVEALSPFSIWAEKVDTETNGCGWKDSNYVISGVKMKDFRRARAVLRKAGAYNV